MLEIWFSQLEDSEMIPKEIVYNAMVNLDIFWHDKLDMIINGERYPIVEQIGDFFVVILWRDSDERNQYGLFHQSLDTRIQEYWPEF